MARHPLKLISIVFIVSMKQYAANAGDNVTKTFSAAGWRLACRRLLQPENGNSQSRHGQYFCGNAANQVVS